MTKALYATSVYHYDHVLLAMKEVFEEVGLVRQLELTPTTLAKLRSLPVPASVLELLARRVRDKSTLPDFSSSLGLAQLINPLSARIGFALSPRLIKSINSAYARRVAVTSRNYDVLHFVEGLGYKALSERRFDVAICERRNFHHEVFEEQIDLIGGFPVNGRRDPIAEVLDYEYDASDYIFVYSNAVKQSFLSRGYAEHKIKVVPIGIGPQLNRLKLERDPFQLTYVGRGDPFKGLDVAVAIVKALGAPFRLKVAGPMSPAVKNWLAAQSNTEYLGILNRVELRQLYSTSGAMVLPSTESFGLAAAEAVYHGLPLICSDMTGIAEYLPEATRTVVQGRDPDVWAAAVIRMLDGDRGGYGGGGAAVLDDAFQSLTWASTARNVRETYLSVLNDMNV